MSPTDEFKKGWNPASIYHSVCAFANDFDDLGGGYILVGVDSDDDTGMAVRPVEGVPIEEMDDELIGNAVLLGNDYFTIIRIVYEEYATVENGTATVEQACKVIQSRVSIMLAETE